MAGHKNTLAGQVKNFCRASHGNPILFAAIEPKPLPNYQCRGFEQPFSQSLPRHRSRGEHGS
jgi:hypothetical protein